jgi:uncharacterized protein YcfJ
MFKKTAFGAALFGLALSASAQNTGAFSDYAEVLRVEPIFRTVQVSNPVQQCWQEPVSYQQNVGHGHRYARGGQGRGRSYTGPIVGGVVGGLLGNQFGKGDGRTLLTVAGAVLGASVGNDVSRRSHRRARHQQTRTVTVSEQRCSTSQNYTQRQQNDGYLVEYRYQGRVYSTRMAYDPGRRLPVSVQVVPQG